MKISFFLGSMRRGGAERVISILANHYSAKGWDVEIALLLDTTVQYQLNENIKIIDLTAGTGSYFKRLPSWLKKIRKYVKNSKPDRIVSFIGRINLLVATACRGLNVPIIASERNDPKQDGRSKFMLWLCNRCYRRVKTVVFQTSYQEQCFSSKLKNKSCIIQNPVTVKVEPSNISENYIVTAGRLIEQKNQKLLIDSFKIVNEVYPDFKLDIYGEGALKETLQNQIETLNLKEVVSLKGAVSDLHERIANASVFVISSEFEGASNALIEAMMLGLPCITTNYPGANEVIFDGENGLVVERNNVQALADAIMKILKDKDLQSQLRKQALATSEIYKTENVIKKWESVIE